MILILVVLLESNNKHHVWDEICTYTHNSNIVSRKTQSVVIRFCFAVFKLKSDTIVQNIIFCVVRFIFSRTSCNSIVILTSNLLIPNQK